MTHSMIVHANISKSFKDPVLEQAEFALEEGLIHGLVGRNGTGKTTLMSILAGQQKCAGELQVFGQNPWDNKATMDRTVFTGVDTPYPPLWNLGGILDVAAKRYPNWDSATADRLVSAFNLPLDTRFDRASRGERSMLAIVVALAARAELTLLDEPYVGLDVQNRDIFYRELMAAQEARPSTWVLATHNLEESAKLIDSFLVLRDGRISQYSSEDLEDAYVIVDNAPELADSALEVQESMGRTRVVVPRSVAQGAPLPLDRAVALLTGGERND